MKRSFGDILAGMDRERQRKFEAKLPHWAEAGCTVPSGLALEQCSSEAAAEYKASLTGGFLCDLTGGLGVDSMAFSRKCGKVLYFERDGILTDAARENFRRLGADNIECICSETGIDSAIPECDWIYLDPARRDGSGKKVFLLEDCSPDVTALLPLLRTRAPHIMIKLSPMADLTMLSRRLGEDLKEIHVVGFKGEVKELLCILERGFRGEYTIKAIELEGLRGISFRPSEEESSKVLLCGNPVPGDTLFEPSPVLLKAGAFNIIGLPRLSMSTHLYIGRTSLPGKSFRITEVLPFGKESFRTIASRMTNAEVTARNIPMTSDELRSRLKMKSGGRTHIFGAASGTGRLLIVTESLQG